MTTIAYRDGIIAYDSRVTADGFIMDDNYEKRIDAGGVNFFLCGATSDWDAFIESYLTTKESKRSLDISALIYDNENKKLLRSSVESDGEIYRIWSSPLRIDAHHSFGSGRDFALAFMYTGMTAEQSVQAASIFDASTGGFIRTFSLPK